MKKPSTNNAKNTKTDKAPASPGAGTDLFPADEQVKLPTAAAAEIPRTYHQAFNLSLIAVAAANARKEFDPVKMGKMKASIAEKGIQTPLWIRELPAPDKDGHTHEVIAGSSRRLNALELGLLSVPVFDYGTITDQMADELADLENAQRADLNDAEKALSYARMKEKYGWDVFNAEQPEKSLAHRLSLGGKSEAHQWMRLARMPKACLEALALGGNGGITRSVAAQICRIGDPTRQNEALTMAMRDRWTDKMAGEIIDKEFLAELKGVPFDRSDETLLPKAGSCDKCPFRSGNQLDLSPELRRRGDICTKPGCLRDKHKAHFGRLADEHKKNGGDVWSEKKAREMGLGERNTYIHSDFVDIDGDVYRLDQRDYSNRKTRAVIAPLLKSGEIKPILAFTNDGTCRIMEIVPKEATRKLCQERGLFKKESTTSNKSARNEENELRKKKVRARLIIARQLTGLTAIATRQAEKKDFVGGGEKSFDFQLVRLAAWALADRLPLEWAKGIARRRGLEKTQFKLSNDCNWERSAIPKLVLECRNAGELAAWLVELLAFEDTGWKGEDTLGRAGYFNKPEETGAARVADLLTVDLKELVKIARKDQEAAEAEKAKLKKGKGKAAGEIKDTDLAKMDPILRDVLLNKARRMKAVSPGTWGLMRVQKQLKVAAGTASQIVGAINEESKAAAEPDASLMKEATTLLIKMKKRKRAHEFTAAAVKKALKVTDAMAAAIVKKLSKPTPEEAKA